MTELIALLNVEDVGRSIAFYEVAFGATVESQWEMEGRVRWARIAFDGGKLMLNTPDAARSDERRGRAEFSDTVLYLSCEDAGARRSALQELGLEVGPLQQEDYGNDEFSLRDPDGYAIRFSSERT